MRPNPAGQSGKTLCGATPEATGYAPREINVDARILFWSGALANMGVIVGLVALGIRQVRRGEIAAHRRSMLTSAGLVAFFLVSYLFKRTLIGGEDLDTWSRIALTNLYIHETLVVAMLLAGGVAFVRGRALSKTRRVSGRDEDPPASAEALLGHRRAGWAAVIAAVFGFLTACGILFGMLVRA